MLKIYSYKGKAEFLATVTSAVSHYIYSEIILIWSFAFLIIIGAQLLIMFFIFLIEQFLLDNIFVEIKIRIFSGFFHVQKVQQFILAEKSLNIFYKMN